MRKNILLLCAAIILPLAASAQRRGGGSSGEEGRSARPAKPPTAGQLEDLNPARLLIDKRKKLSLADSQVTQLKALDKKIGERNAAIYAEYDSVRKEIRFPSNGPQGGEMGASMGTGARGNRNRASGASAGTGGGGANPDMTPEAMAKMRAQLQALAAIALKIQERRPTDIAESLALLTPDQSAKAQEFVAEQNTEFDRILPRAGRGG
jgi:hypothetical protein